MRVISLLTRSRARLAGLVGGVVDAAEQSGHQGAQWAGRAAQPVRDL
jgi:hypothetical protein